MAVAPHLVTLVPGNAEANFARIGAELGFPGVNWKPEAMLQELRMRMTHFVIEVGERDEAEAVSVGNFHFAVFLFRRVGAHGDVNFVVDDNDREDAILFFGKGFVNDAISPVQTKQSNLKRFMSPRGASVRVWRQP